jgi:hypothetical protein
MRNAAAARSDAIVDIIHYNAAHPELIAPKRKKPQALPLRLFKTLPGPNRAIRT